MPEFATGGIIEGPVDLNLDNGYIVNARESHNHGPDCLECSGWPELDDEPES